MENKRLNLERVVAAPVLTGNVSDYMWTGVIKSENITQYIIPDDRKRAEFKKLVEELEAAVKSYRSNDKIVNSNVIRFRETLLSTAENASLEGKILEICGKIKIMLNGNSIDKALYWVEFCREYEKVKQKNPAEFKALRPEDRKTLEQFRVAITTSEPQIREVYSAEENKYASYQFMTLEQEAKHKRKGASPVEQLMKVIRTVYGEEKIDNQKGIAFLREIAEGITIVDLKTILGNSRYADMQYISIFKNYLLKIGYTAEQINSMTYEELRDKSDELNQKDKIGDGESNFDLHKNMVADTIISGIKYVDVSKMMTIYMSRMIDLLDSMAPEKEAFEGTYGRDSFDELANIARQNINREDLNYSNGSSEQSFQKMKRIEFMIRKIIESGVVAKNESVHIKAGEISQTHTFKKVQEAAKKFCDGIYITSVTRLHLLYNAFHNPEEISSWSDELLKRVEISDSDVQALSLMNFENLKRFRDIGRMTDEDIKNLLIENRNGEIDLSINESFEEDDQRYQMLMENKRVVLKRLYEEGFISEEQIGKYFKSDFITMEMLLTLEEGKSAEEIEVLHRNLKPFINDDLLLKGYREYTEKYLELKKYQMTHPDDEEKITELTKEVNFYREEKERFREAFLRYNKIPENERIQFGDELLEKYYIEMEVSDEVLKESLKLLYEDNLIGLENIIHTDESNIIPMLDTLSLEDAAKVRNSMTSEQLEKMLDAVFTDSTFSDERKFIVVMNLVGEDNEEDRAIREYYLAQLDFNDNEKKSRTKGKRKIINPGSTVPSNKYVYPDFVKWKFYKALDKDVRVTRYSNGFVEFASNRLGARIIEKYYDGEKPAYGTATYILDENEYRRNEADLITIAPKGNILESSVLKEITPQKQRVAHRTQSADRTWMHDMTRYFGIDFEKMQDSRYSEEEIKTLAGVIEKYKASYEMIM